MSRDFWIGRHIWVMLSSTGLVNEGAEVLVNKCEALDSCLRHVFIRRAAAGRLGPGPSAAATGAGTGLGRAPRRGQLGQAAPTSPRQPPAAQGLAPVLVSAGSPAASESVPGSPSAPFPGMPESAAALQVRNPGGSTESSGSLLPCSQLDTKSSVT